MTALFPPHGVQDTDAGPSDGRLSRIEAQLELLLEDARRRDAELEPLRDLAAEVGLLAGPAMRSVTRRVAHLDERGYLTFARGGLGVVDRVVSSFSDEDVDALGDNIVLILDTLKDLTQPEIMHLLRRTAVAAQEQEHDLDAGSPPSTFALVRRLRDPEVRRGLARALDLLRSIGSDAAVGPARPVDHPTTPSPRR